MNRLVRALTGLITIWCLGCSSYEQLLAQLVGPGAGPGMMCDSETEMVDAAGGATATSHDAGNVKTISATGATSSSGFTCSCQSCHSATPAVLVVVAEPVPTPRVPEAAPAELLSVARKPLVPPPQGEPQRA